MSDYEFDNDDIDESEEGETAPETGLANTVSIKAPGISIERAVDEATMSGIIALIFPGPSVVPFGGGATPRQQQQHQPQGDVSDDPLWDEDLSLGEFLHETEARTFPQKICAAGYYLMQFRNRSSFDRDEIRDALKTAHEDLPANFPRDFTAAAQSKLIVQAGEPNQYRVSSSGKKAVNSQFRDLPKRRPPRRRRAGQSSSASSNGEIE